MYNLIIDLVPPEIQKVLVKGVSKKDEEYGINNYKKGPGTEYNKIRKWEGKSSLFINGMVKRMMS